MPKRNIRTVITELDDVGSATKRFVLMDPEGWELPPFQPGAHLDVYLPNGVVRTYSLINDPAENDRYSFAVKREAKGRGGSAYLHDSVRKGDELGVGLPRGGLNIDGRQQVFIAGGIGLTPFLSAAKALRRAGRDDFMLHVLSRGAPPLADELNSLLASGVAKVHDTSATTRPRITDLVGAPDQSTRISCCGPEGLLHAFEDAVRDWNEGQVHLERFVAPPPVVDPSARSYTLVLKRSGIEIDVAAGQSMLDALADHGIDLPSSCGGGICGVCRVTWLEGEPIHRDRILQPPERESALMACVAQSAGERLVVDL